MNIASIIWWNIIRKWAANFLYFQALFSRNESIFIPLLGYWKVFLVPKVKEKSKSEETKSIFSSYFLSRCKQKLAPFNILNTKEKMSTSTLISFWVNVIHKAFSGKQIVVWRF